MATLEASLKLRDQFTNQLNKINNSLKRATGGMDDFKESVNSVQQPLNQIAAAASKGMSALNSSMNRGMQSAYSVVKSSTEKILTVFSNFGNRIKNNMNQSVVGSKMVSGFEKLSSTASSAFSKVSSGLNKLTGRDKKLQALDTINTQLDRLKNKETKIKLNVDGFEKMQSKIRQYEDTINTLNNKRIQIKAEASNYKDVKSRIDAISRQMESLNQKKAVLEFKTSKMDAAKSQLAIVQTEINKLNNTKISLGTSAFSSSISKLKNMGQSSFNAIKNGASSMASGLKNHFSQSAQSGESFANSLQSMGSKSTSVFKSILAASGVMAAVSATMNTLKSGISSMIGELSNSGATWQTFEGNMSIFGKSGQEIQAVKNDLQEFAQQTIYSSSDMASTYAQLAAVGTKNTTQLVKGFGGLASAAEDPLQAMKTLSQQATQMAAKPKVQWEDFKLILEQTPAGMAAIAKTMGKTTSELVADVQNGGIATQEFFDAISKTGTNDQFTKMATQFKTVGQAMDGLKEGLANKLQPTFDKVSKKIIDIIGNVSDKLNEVNFDALASKLGNVFNKIASFGSKLVGVFSGIDFSGIFDSLVSNAKNIFSQIKLSDLMLEIASLKTAITGAFNGIAASLSKYGSSISQAWGTIFTKLVPLALSSLSTILGQIPSFISSLIDIILPIVDVISNAFSRLDFSGIQTLIASVIPALQNGLSTMMAIVQPAIENVVHSFVNLWNAAQPLISVLSAALMPALQILGAFLGGVIKGILIGVSALFDGLRIAIQLLTPIISFLVNVFSAIAPVLTTIAQWVGTVIGMFANLSSASSGLGSIIQSAWSNIMNAINVAASAVIGIVNNVKSIFVSLGSAGSSLSSIVSAAWNAMTSAISGAASTIFGIVSGIVGSFKSLWSLDLSGAGSAIMNSLLNGLMSAWGKVKDFVGGIAGWIKDHKGPIEYDRKLLIPAGKSIMQGLNEGLETQFSDVQKKVSSMAKTLSNNFDGKLSTSNSVSLTETVNRQLVDSYKPLKMAVIPDVVRTIVDVVKPAVLPNIENVYRYIQETVIPDQTKNSAKEFREISPEDIGRLKFSALGDDKESKNRNSTITMNNTFNIQTIDGEPVDTEALLQEFEDKIIELIDSDLS